MTEGDTIVAVCDGKLCDDIERLGVRIAVVDIVASTIELKGIGWVDANTILLNVLVYIRDGNHRAESATEAHQRFIG